MNVPLSSLRLIDEATIDILIRQAGKPAITDITGDFLRDLHTALEKLQPDEEEWGHLRHRLGGTSGTMGFVRLHEAFKLAQTLPDPAGLAALHACISETQAALRDALAAR
ncbi:MAG: hypothetical protein MO847_08935 [Candidatus Protistobacter heckmanni]|nr:hypothetical protein [Candidatus Protistobacter heckmanni]